MQIKIKKGYIAVYGESLPIKIDRFLIGGEKKVKASTRPPFIFFENKDAEIPWIINHELIHFRQVYELLFIGALLLDILERVYARIFLKMSAQEAYYYSSIEQEAFLNQNNPEYLKNRKLFSIFKYLRKKKKITIDGKGNILIEKEKTEV